MANFILTIDMITREAVRLWKNTNAFMQHVDMQFDDSYARLAPRSATHCASGCRMTTSSERDLR